MELCGQMVDGSIFEAKPDFDAHLQGSGDMQARFEHQIHVGKVTFNQIRIL